MDLSDFDTAADAEVGAKMEVRNPNSGEVMRHDPDEANPEGRPFTITYYGMDSPKVVEFARKQADRRIAQAQRTRQPIPTAVISADNIELLAFATKEWDIVLGGVKPPNDLKAYRAAYAKFPWLYDEGERFAGLRSNFSKA